MALSAISTTGVVVAVVPPILANNGTIGSLICLSIQEMIIRTIFDECSVLGGFLCLSMIGHTKSSPITIVGIVEENSRSYVKLGKLIHLSQVVAVFLTLLVWSALPVFSLAWSCPLP